MMQQEKIQLASYRRLLCIKQVSLSSSLFSGLWWLSKFLVQAQTWIIWRINHCENLFLCYRNIEKRTGKHQFLYLPEWGISYDRCFLWNWKGETSGNNWNRVMKLSLMKSLFIISLLLLCLERVINQSWDVTVRREKDVCF